MTDKLTDVQEDYLETILALVEQAGSARVRDIARQLGVSNATVTVALRALTKRNLVNYAPYEFVTMTQTGRTIAREITERHRVFKRFLVEVLGVDEPTAETNACRMEHAVDRKVFRLMRRYLEGFGRQPADTDE